jgi:UDP-N-acetylmuramoyl-tripeptide--D-alanyl-D-alanine ligase
MGAASDVCVADQGLAGPAARRARVEGQEILLPRPGRHHLLNLAAAWTVARRLGAEPAALAASLGGATFASDRGDVYRLGSWTLMDDSYNANPNSLRAALEWLREAPASGRRWAVLGDMLELGDQGPELHAECGRDAARGGIHELAATGPLCRHMIDAAHEAGMTHARHFDDWEALAAMLLRRLGDGDLVLVKGSRGMAMERILDYLEKERGQPREVLI